jgi:YebC/PmpR family DNA-binding regulatory protein
VLVVAEAATDNNTRTVANVKAYFSKNGGSLAPTGSLEFMFARKAVFEFEKPEGVSTDELELDLIEYGLESIESYDEDVYLYGDYTNFGSLSRALEDKGIEVKKASLKRIPSSPIELTEEQMADVEKLLDRLEDDDDIQAVFTNIA